jgi:hypothetical protein
MFEFLVSHLFEVVGIDSNFVGFSLSSVYLVCLLSMLFFGLPVHLSHRDCGCLQCPVGLSLAWVFSLFCFL